MTIAAGTPPLEPATPTDHAPAESTSDVERPRAARVCIAIAYSAVSAPIIGEFIRVWRSDFYPTADDAVHAIHAHDVFSVHTPLVGMYSGISDPGKPFVDHLGPMVFWALAIPERLFSERLGIVIGATIVDLVAAIAIVRVVRRLYGTNGALIAAAVVAITSWSMGRNTLAEPWNPYIALLPLMLVLVYSLELANGALTPLPWVVLCGSFVVQAHYIYIPIVFASIGCGTVLGVIARRQARADDRYHGDDAAPRVRERGRLGRPVVAAAVVGFVCWLFPLLDEFVHWPGNFSRWIDALQHVEGVQIPASSAWDYIARSIGWIPLAARGPLPAKVLFQLPIGVPTLTQVVAWAVTGALVIFAVVLWRRQRRDARLAVMGAVLVPAVVFAVWRMPLSLPVMPVYRITMLWPIGAFVWAAAVVAGITLLAQWDVASRAMHRIPRRAISVVLAVAAVGASIVAVAGVESGRPNSHPDWDATRALVGPTLAHLHHDRRYLIHSDGDLAYFVQYGIMRTMLLHGFATFVPPSDVQLGRYYASGGKHDYILFVTSTVRPLPARARLIAQYDPSTAAQRARLQQTRGVATAVLAREPLRLTPYGERVRRHAVGLVRVGLDTVANGKVTPDGLLDTSLEVLVVYSRATPNRSRAIFTVGPDVVPALEAYSDARSTISSVVVRIAVIPPA